MIKNLNINERLQRSLTTSAASMLERGSFLLVQLVAIPLTLPYLGEERFGAWMVLMSFITILNISDFGMQYGLQNMISEAFGKNQKSVVKEQVSASFVVFSLLAVLLLVTNWLFVPLLDVPKLVGLSSDQYSEEIRSGICLLFGVFALMQPLGISRIVFVAHQKGYITTSWGFLKNLCACLLVIYLAKMEASVGLLVFAVYGISVFFGFIITIHMWIYYPEYRPSLKLSSPRGMKEIFRAGYKFWILQLLSMAANNLDTIIVAQTMNAAAVAVFSVTSKLFRPVMLVQNIFTRPLWPAYAEAKAQNDWRWIQKTFWKSLFWISGISGLMALPLLIFGNPIILWWTRSNLTPDLPLLSGFFAYIIVLGIKSPLIVFLNGLNRLNWQLVYQSFYTVLSFFLKIYLGLKYGAAGVIWGAVISNLIGLVWLQLLEAVYVIRVNIKGSTVS